MSELFSDYHRAKLWRKIWIFLADEQRKLGLPIKLDQIRALEKAADRIDLPRIRQIEQKLKHDVMSHLKAFAEEAPEAEGILHLGATSAFVTDNAEALLFQEATRLLLGKATRVLDLLRKQSLLYKDLETTGYTHFQPAQPVTVGKRFALWAQDLLWDIEELEFSLSRFRPLGCKGTTGTQASFAVLFQKDFQKIKKLDENLCQRMGFARVVALSGQTLSRKSDAWFLQSLSQLAATFSKMSYDLRLLQHLGEVTEAFSKDQIGSSAMPYKQNPMLAERITGLSRFLMNLNHNAAWTHATQWLERSLDDSSNRRLVIPEAFLAADAILESSFRLIAGLNISKKLIGENLKKYQARFETEALMMEKTLSGVSRQAVHEEFRREMLKGKLKARGVKYKLSGVASEQVQSFVKTELEPVLKRLTKLYPKANFDSAVL